MNGMLITDKNQAVYITSILELAETTIISERKTEANFLMDAESNNKKW